MSTHGDQRTVVLDAMRVIDRRGFLRRRDRREAGDDRPLGIGHGQTNSQPTTVVDTVSALDVRPGHRVLDVGSGSGWTTALLGHLVGASGQVIGVERIPDLVEFGRRNLAAHDMAWAQIVPARPGVLGLPDQAPFDRILVSAAASDVPGALIDQLARPGVLVVPVGDRLCRVVRTADGDVQLTDLGGYR